MKFFRTLFSLSPKDATNKGDYFHFPNSDRGIDIKVEDGHIVEATVYAETDKNYKNNFTFKVNNIDAISVKTAAEMTRALSPTEASEACAKKK